jgi:NADH-quinone oxidoreductase chain G
MIYKIYINNKVTSVKANTTVLEACENIGVFIPRFCYHERLSIAGNCRMCLVEVEKSPKPVVSCAMPIMSNMRIFTDTPLVKKARESVLEFILLNHPLDCPVCDQGGECDLQEQTIKFGAEKSRFYDFKRGVEDKNLGPLIKTIMNRCIHCTRCIRFSIEIAGIEDLGTSARGISTEIGTYLEKIFQSELSGNIIDLCPVGALTSKPYAFTSRPWELKTIDSIDVSDGIGSNIKVDLKENEIMRILPRLNDKINEDWISDKTRFSYDGLQSQRLRFPIIKSGLNFFIYTRHSVYSYQDFEFKHNGSSITNWEPSVKKVAELILETNKDIIGIFGNVTDFETQLSFKEFIHSLGSENIGFLNKLHINSDFSTNYKLNSTIARVSESDLCLLIGVNPRYEGSLLNVRLRKRYLKGGFSIATIGSALNLTYPVEHLGLGGKTLNKITKGKHKFCSKLKGAKNPIFILGFSLLGRKDSWGLQTLLNMLYLQTAVLASHWKGLGVLHIDSNQVGALDLGLAYLNPAKIRFTISTYSFSSPSERILYMINVSQCEWSLFLKELFFRNLWNYEFKRLKKNEIYRKFRLETWLISHKGYLESCENSDISLPNATPLEKDALFINTEGRPQISSKILSPQAGTREDWSIFRALSDIVGNSVRYNTLSDLKKRTAILLPSTNSVNKIQKNIIYHVDKAPKEVATFNTHFNSLIEDFYLTNIITRASKIMAECSIFLRKGSSNFK